MLQGSKYNKVCCAIDLHLLLRKGSDGIAVHTLDSSDQSNISFVGPLCPSVNMLATPVFYADVSAIMASVKFEVRLIAISPGCNSVTMLQIWVVGAA